MHYPILLMSVFLNYILVAVVIAFFLCWAPFHSQRLMTLYIAPEDWTPELHTIQTTLFYISGQCLF
jgi:hypothetical protein